MNQNTTSNVPENGNICTKQEKVPFVPPKGWDFIPLLEPQRITEHSWPPGTRPWVSICSITYNHAPYIAECIEGFLMQETTFPVEILIHDDASTDGTADIVREYAEKYPQLIKPVFQKENQYSQGKKAFPLLFEMTKGQYIAACEGDDYWVDDGKIQVQFEVLHDNPRAVMSAHDAEILIEDGEGRGKSLQRREVEHMTKNQFEFIDGEKIISGQYLRTLSVFFRKIKIYDGKKEYEKIVNGDRYLFSMLAVHGGVLLSDRKAAVYRVHPGGVFSGADRKKRMRNMILSRFAIAKEIDSKFQHIVYRHLVQVCCSHLGGSIKNLQADDVCFLVKSWIRCFWGSFRSYGKINFLNAASLQVYMIFAPSKTIVLLGLHVIKEVVKKISGISSSAK